MSRMPVFKYRKSMYHIKEHFPYVLALPVNERPPATYEADNFLLWQVHLSFMRSSWAYLVLTGAVSGPHM